MKKIFFVAAIWIYIFFLAGLFLHTSVNKQYIFNKYSVGYFVLIIVCVLLTIPYIGFVTYITRTTSYRIRKKKIILTPLRKIGLLSALAILFLIGGDQIMRLNGFQEERKVYNMDYDPFLQQKLRKNLPGDEFHINSFGFRADEISIVKPKDAYRIIILGGSTAYGVPVGYSQTASKLLGDMLQKQYAKKIEVINAAVSGYTSEHTVIDYLFRVGDFKPDMVIMWHGVNDLYASCPDPSLNLSYQANYSHYLGPVKNMVTSYFSPPIISIHLLPLDYISRFVQTHLYTDLHFLITHINTTTLKNQLSQIPAVDKKYPSIASYRRNLENFASILRSQHVQLILGNQPNMYSTSEKYGMNAMYCYDGKTRATLASWTKGMEFMNKVTKDVAEHNNIPFVDLDAALPRNPEYFADQVHWTPKGNEVAAKKLYNLIISGNFIQ